MKSSWLLVFVLIGACQKEPAIVVRFDPTDMSHRVDAAQVAVDADAGAVKKPISCLTDNECMLIPDGCCDCSTGGKVRSVKKGKVMHLMTDRAVLCRTTMCPMEISTDPSCAKRAACVDNQCGFREPTPAERAENDAAFAEIAKERKKNKKKK